MIGRLLLLVGSVLVTLILLELGLRLARGPEALLHWPNLVLQVRIGTAAQNLERRFVYDPTLGYVQRAGHSSPKMNYDAEGFRLMPPLPAGAADLPPVLATGDSYTQGDEVDDGETWPAYLQGLIGRRTVNAGVAAYGLDQTVLRTEQLVPLVRPAAIVVGFITDDVRRSEMSRTWGTEKPYFDVKDGKLELRNVPVPPSPDPRDTLTFLQHAFGWSLLVDFVLDNQGWRYEWAVDHLRVAPRGTGERVACLLMQRLAALKIPTLVVAQYDFYLWQDPEFAAEQRRVSRVVLRCASEAGLGALDLYEPTERAVRERGRNAIYLTWHLSPEGNRLTAEAIAAELKRRGMIP
jgi:hypothetical protein